MLYVLQYMAMKQEFEDIIEYILIIAPFIVIATIFRYIVVLITN